MHISNKSIIFVVEIITKPITTMTVAELLELLKDADRDAVVVCSDNCGGDYILGDVCFLDGFVELG